MSIVPYEQSPDFNDFFSFLFNLAWISLDNCWYNLQYWIHSVISMNFNHWIAYVITLVYVLAGEFRITQIEWYLNESLKYFLSKKKSQIPQILFFVLRRMLSNDSFWCFVILFFKKMIFSFSRVNAHQEVYIDESVTLRGHPYSTVLRSSTTLKTLDLRKTNRILP